MKKYLGNPFRPREDQQKIKSSAINIRQAVRACYLRFGLEGYGWVHHECLEKNLKPNKHNRTILEVKAGTNPVQQIFHLIGKQGSRMNKENRPDMEKKEKMAHE